MYSFNAPKEIRVCVDVRKGNQAILRKKTTKVESGIVKITNSTVFPKADLNNAFYQIELEPDTRNMTTFCKTG